MAADPKKSTLPADCAVRFDHLAFSYGSGYIFEDVSFSVYRDEFVSIVGGSGSGKSTLLLLMAGFLGHKNRAILRGDGFLQPAMMFQGTGLFDWMSVGDNIKFPMRLKRHPEAFIEERATQLLKMVRLHSRINSWPKDLSHGMRQRVELARAWAADTSIILLDEPLSGLDYRLRCDLQEDLLRLWERERRTVVMVTHDPEEACFLSDRVIVVQNTRSVVEIKISLARPRSNALRYETDLLTIKKQILCRMK